MKAGKDEERVMGLVLCCGSCEKYHEWRDGAYSKKELVKSKEYARWPKMMMMVRQRSDK